MIRAEGLPSTALHSVGLHAQIDPDVGHDCRCCPDEQIPNVDIPHES